jgi:hypothetical protein
VLYNQPLDQPSNPNAPYTDGDPQAGIQGSIVPAASIEFDQREIVEVITRANVRGYSDFSGTPCAIPANSDLLQLRKAIEGFITSNSWIIDTVITKTIHGPGADFADLNAAIEWLTHYRITSNGFVHFVSAGSASGVAQMYTYNKSVALVHPDLIRTDWAGAPLIGAPPNINDFQYTGNISNDANAQLAMLRGRFGTELRFVNGAGLSIGSSTNIKSFLITNDSTTQTGLMFNGGIPGCTNCSVHGFGSYNIMMNECNAWTGGSFVTASGCTNGYGFEFQGDLSLGALQTIAASNMTGLLMQYGTTIRQGGAFALCVKGNSSNGIVMLGSASASLSQCTFQYNGGYAINVVGGFAWAGNSSFSGNANDIYAADGAQVIASGSAGIARTSPPMNTIGNVNAAINY